MIIYDSKIFEHSLLFESLRLEHEMHDGTSDVNVLEYLWLRQVMLSFSKIARYDYESYGTFLTAKDVLCRQ